MSEAEKTISTFYQAFQAKDFAGMASLYAPDVSFSDPIFDHHGYRANAMWQMLLTSGSDLQLTFDQVKGNDQEKTGSAVWTAKYSFGPQKRPVINVVHASFVFDNQFRIVKHRDEFDFYKWSTQAIGGVAYLLWWTEFFKSKVRGQAQANLDKFISREKLEPVK
jgi:limonene-1,2-epoxide hydrolase